MSDYTLVLEASREDRRIKVSVYERGGGFEGTLRPYEDRMVAWEQVQSGIAEVTNLLNRANKRGKVSTEIFQSLKKAGRLLFDLLIPPKAAEKLNTSQLVSLILYIDDKLVHIPWELLFNGQHFLCRRFAMGRVVSTSQVPAASSKRALRTPLKVLVIADPRQDLKAAYREGVEIRNLLDRQPKDFQVDLKSAPVDIAFVKKNLRDYDLVHYAGHADYDPQNPSEGGWLLTDGRLKASEISTMGGLQAMPFLVFSNACQSGQSGEWRVHEQYGQQIFGLANAHLMAGVQHYIGTFWEILDEPSSEFAKQLYHFLGQGDQIGDAVRKAREKLIETFGEETIVWASYMLYGDPTFSFTSRNDKPATIAPTQIASPTEWSHAMRSQAAVSPVSVARRRPLLPYIIFGVLAVGIAIPAIGLLSRKSAPQQNAIVVPAKPATPPLPSKAAPEKETPPPAIEPQLVTSKSAPVKIAKVEKTAEANRIEIKASSLDRAPPKTLPKDVPIAKDAKEEVAIKTEPAPPVVAAPLSLSMNIIGQRKDAAGNYTEVLVNEGSVLRSRDNFQVHVEANRPAYVYILIYDSQGRATQLFPDPKIDRPEFFEAGGKAVIPRRDLWYWLDDETGTETVYVLASEKPMTDIRGLLAKMMVTDDNGKKNASQEIKRQITIMQRGVGGITQGQTVTYTLSDGKKIQKVTDVVTGTGSVVRAVSFQHR
jgi:CHAT domain-containing protein